MGRHSVQQAPRQMKSTKPHPVWSGLGCLMIIVVLFMSVGASAVAIDLIKANRWPFPQQLLGHVYFPRLFYSTDGLAYIFNAISSVNNLKAYIALTLVFTVILSGIVSVLYALVYRMVGPSKYGPTDAPPVRMKINKRQR
jgi:hypothetical protein